MSDVIREFQLSDIKTLNEIHRLGRVDELANLPDEIDAPPFLENPESRKLFDQSRILVHEQHGVIQGFSGHVNNYIVWLYVHPDARGQGVARSLVTAMLGDLQEQVVYLSLLAENKAARTCYERLGFLVHETFDFEYKGFPVQGLRMYLDQQTKASKVA